MQAGRAGSVELDGAAVVLTVLALLLRGAHEAAQKIPWKQTQVPSGARQRHAVGAPGPGNPTFHSTVSPGLDGTSGGSPTSLWEGPDSWGKTTRAHPGTQHGSLTALEDRHQNHVAGRSPSSRHACASHVCTFTLFTERSGSIHVHTWWPPSPMGLPPVILPSSTFYSKNNTSIQTREIRKSPEAKPPGKKKPQKCSRAVWTDSGT